MNTITGERRAQLREWGRLGGLKRAQAFTTEYQRAVRAKVRHESNVANGRKGGIAYVKKYGYRKLVDQARQYRLSHPSELEQIVESALVAIGATDYEREGWLFPESQRECNTGDFVFRSRKRVVYADGAAWHNGKPMPFADCADRLARDIANDNYLRARGWRVIRLSEAEIRAHANGTDGGAMRAKLYVEIFGEVVYR